MKNMLLFILIATSLSAFANRESGGRRGAATTVFLNFTSPGNGIDHKTFNLADQLIEEADQDGFVKEQARKRWGREGEITICVHFQGGAFHGVGSSRDFIKAIAPSIVQDNREQDLQRTNIFVGISCDKVEEATEQDITAYLD